MPKLSSGFVIAGAYADKIRRTLFAQLRDYLRKDKEWGQRIALAVAQLNRFLYTLLVERIKIDKGDVVRIRIDYDIDETTKSINWLWNTLTIEAFRRIPQDEVDKITKELVTKAVEISTAAVVYALEKLGETFDGDIVYTIKLGDREVGTAIVTLINENIGVLKRGAVIEPTPAVFDKVKLVVEPGKTIEDTLRDVLSTVIQSAKHVDADEAVKVINAIRDRISAKPIVKYEEAEEE
ncbi:MAG: DUF2258 domain-containing protein [Ignisphaera sp.]